jgi:hypothetical protein
VFKSYGEILARAMVRRWQARPGADSRDLWFVVAQHPRLTARTADVLDGKETMMVVDCEVLSVVGSRDVSLETMETH